MPILTYTRIEAIGMPWESAPSLRTWWIGILSGFEDLRELLARLGGRATP